MQCLSICCWPPALMESMNRVAATRNPGTWPSHCQNRIYLPSAGSPRGILRVRQERRLKRRERYQFDVDPDQRRCRLYFPTCSASREMKRTIIMITDRKRVSDLGKVTDPWPISLSQLVPRCSIIASIRELQAGTSRRPDFSFQCCLDTRAATGMFEMASS